MRSAFALLVIAALAAACGDPSGPPPSALLEAASPTAQDAPAGSVAPDTPAVRLLKPDGSPIAGATVVFSIATGGGSLAGASATTDASGVARVASWTLGSQPGLNSLIATVPRYSATDVVFEANGCATEHVLDHELGEFVRLKGSARCPAPTLLFDAALAGGHEYLLLLESLPLTGTFEGGLFPGSFSGSGFGFALDIAPQTATATHAVRLRTQAAVQDDTGTYAWDFGAGRLRELHPDTPPEQVPAPKLLRQGRALDLNSAVADPVPGDTIVVRLEGLPRLGIATGNQHAVIRLVTPHIIIAEDVRLGTLTRQNGNLNSPLPQPVLDSLAAEYAAHAMVQGDLLFANRHNSAVEDVPPNRVIAVHSLTPQDDVWGYTYSSTNYFVWDYWVQTDGSTRGLNQHPQRVTDNLFMHEIAHMRHWGLLQRAGAPPRGNRWLVEGFARFSERLPIAARLLGQTSPPRTDNVVLPRNPAFNNAYFLDDVPTYGSASAGMFFGYQNSAFVFDYFADLVALEGGDWQQALRDFLVAAGARETLDPVIQQWVGLSGFAELFTRSRVALYADDIGTAGLPFWTQYHTYRLRESRALPEDLQPRDPRNAWVRVPIGAAATINGSVGGGGAQGFVLVGEAGDPPSRIALGTPIASRVHISLVRVR